jgi:hypothetical protein
MRGTIYFLKLLIISLSAGLLLFSSTGCSENGQSNLEIATNKSKVKTERTGFSKELEQLLGKKIELLKNLATNPQIIEIIKRFNEKNQDISISDILKDDKKWKETKGIDDFIKPFIINECAQFLIEFQEQYDEFPEIFITDENGLIVGETNKTSDYYQADEQWWIKAYNNGIGRIYFGEIEYDESAHAEAISIYIPVMDSQYNKAIGVIKAVCDITAIKMEL